VADVVPGLLVAWSGTRPMSRLLRIDDELVLGRELLGETDDDRISRRHVRITRDLVITDLGSRNGTHLDAQRLPTTPTPGRPLSILRAGGTVAVLLADIAPYEAPAIRAHPELVPGRRTSALHAGLVAAARDPAHVVVHGHPGGGSSHLARTYAKMIDRVPVRIEDSLLLTADATLEVMASVEASPELRLIVIHSPFSLPFKPALDAFLTERARWFDLATVQERADELAGIIAEITGRKDPPLRCAGSVLEYGLLRHQDSIGTLVQALYELEPRPGGERVRAQDVVETIQAHWVRVGGLPKPRRYPR
jgi:hypothetical protein